MSRPRGWTVLGSGPMADAVRAELERDPDAYAPQTWSIKPVGICPCCDEEVFSCKTKHTNWEEGFATHSNVVHPRCDAKTSLPDPNGTAAGCCCKAPNWGPKHADAKATQKKPRKRKAAQKEPRKQKTKQKVHR